MRCQSTLRLVVVQTSQVDDRSHTVTYPDICSNYRVKIGAVGIKNLEDLANRNSSVTVRTLIY